MDYFSFYELKHISSQIDLSVMGYEYQDNGCYKTRLSVCSQSLKMCFRDHSLVQ